MNHEHRVLLAESTRATALLLGLAVSGLGGGCSLAIDVEPDCVDSSCGAYICAPDQIACRDTCGQDGDCASGFACDSSVCVSTGCRITVATDALPMPSLISEIEPVWVTGPNVDSQLVVLASNRHGFGLRRFSLGGVAVPNDPVAEPLGMFTIIEGNPLRRRFRVDPVYRRGNLENAVSSRIDFSFTDVPSTGDIANLGTFDFGPPISPPAKRALINATTNRNAELLDTSVAALDSGYIVGWTQRRSARPEARVLAVGATGGAADIDQSVVVSADTEASERLAVVRVGDVPVVVYEANDGGDRRVILRPLQADGRPVGRGVLMSGRDAANVTVDAVAAFGGDDRAIVYWGNVDNGEVEVMRATVTSGDIALLEPGESVVFPSVSSTLPVDEILLWDAAAGANDSALLLRGTARGKSDVWLVRVAESGSLASIPVAAGMPAGAVPLEVDVVATDDGYAAFWRVEAADGTASVAYRRFVCD